MRKKSAIVRAAMEPEKKQKAGEILERLGLRHSEAINIFYSMIIEHRGLPFQVRLGEPDSQEGGTQTDHDLSPEILPHLRKSIRLNRRIGRELPL